MITQYADAGLVFPRSAERSVPRLPSRPRRHDPVGRRRPDGISRRPRGGRDRVEVGFLTMTPDDRARLGAAHIYDPEADDADEQLRLLERLESDGLGPDTLLSADRLGTLVLSAFEQLIRPGRRRTTEEVAAATGTSGDMLRRVWRAWGFPDPAPDDACW